MSTCTRRSFVGAVAAGSATALSAASAKPTLLLPADVPADAFAEFAIQRYSSHSEALRVLRQGQGRVIVFGSPTLARMAKAIERPITFANLGGHINDRCESTFIDFVSLDLWRSQWRLGEWAARTIGKRAAIACNLHDAGFDYVRAFRHGFESAGGAVVSESVFHEGGAPADFASADLVYAAFANSAIPSLPALPCLAGPGTTISHAISAKSFRQDPYQELAARLSGAARNGHERLFRNDAEIATLGAITGDGPCFDCLHAEQTGWSTPFIA